uniref:Uncharacterized protein n=1 Tax=Vitis vinifera TaxID=29760 RepID=F6HPS9_VITVI
MAFLCRAPSFQPQTQLLNLGFHRAISSPQLPPVSNFPCTPLSSSLIWGEWGWNVKPDTAGTR